ncbi:MAG: alpha/beta hydrolase [Methanospirillum sp.]|uniref:alpha/beta fold hydrolase n=1 Tax=Methanospirillum sp. TaxID=45200 RepID=UPI00237005B5|nr:alpha/beta hydrolase [Methanospirillum sp.]MDD1729773.1 alpha/beta hydrolase [Methanospirillum sp.]
MLIQYPVHTIQTGEIQTAYRSIGEGEPIILIMAVGGTMSAWDRRLLLKLSSGYRLILFDNRGIGDSSGEELECSIPAMAEDVFHLMDMLGLSDAHIFGYSMGSMIGLQLAALHPEKVRSLLLCCVSKDGGDTYTRIEPWINTSRPEIIAFQARFPPAFLNEHKDLRKIFPPSSHPVHPSTIFRQLNAINQWNLDIESLATITMPVLILAGTEDIITPLEEGRKIASAISSAQVIPIEGGGHGMMYQYTDRIATLALDFLSVMNRS